MAAEPVPPVTDNERDAQTLREIVLGTEAAANASEEVEAALTDWGVPLGEGRSALARLVAALSAATTERDAAIASAEREGWRANAAEERAEALAAQLQQAREALSWALDALELAFKRLDSVDEYSPEHYLIRQAGFDKARAALAVAAPATTEGKT